MKRIPEWLRGGTRLLLALATVFAVGPGLRPGGRPASVPVAEAGSGPTVTVPPTNNTMALDGSCSGAEYAGAAQTQFSMPTATDFPTVTVYMLHTTHDLYICLVGMGLVNPLSIASERIGVYVDRDNDGGALDTGDFVVRVNPLSVASANYWGGSSFNGADPGGWAAQSAVCNELCEWVVAEVRLSRTVVGGWKHTAGLALFYENYAAPGDDYGWPSNGVKLNPAAWGNISLITAPLTVNESGLAPAVDGTCGMGGGSEYGDAAPVSFAGGANAAPVDVFVKHTTADLYVCFYNLAVPSVGTQNGPNAVVYANRLGLAGSATTPDDLAFSISYNGAAAAQRGGGGGYSGPDPGGYSAARAQGGSNWSAEFRISAATLGGGWNRTIDLTFAAQWVGFVGNDFGWPAAYLWNLPQTWGTAYLSSTPAVTGNDLAITSIEVTQSIQDLANSIPLIRGKRTFVRVSLSTTANVNAVEARLFGSVNGLSLGSPLVPLNPGGRINAITTPTRTVENDSFLFELPESWIASTQPVVLRAEINPTHALPENNFANNSLSTAPLSFLPANTLTIISVNFRSRRENGSLAQASERDLAMFESEVRRLYPINALKVYPKSVIHEGPLYANECPNFPWICVNDVPNAVYVLTELVFIRADMALVSVPIHALVHDRGDNGSGTGSGFMRGMGLPGVAVAASPTGPATWGWDPDGSYGDWYGAHELGHALGLNHTNGGCGEAGPYQVGTNPGAILGSTFFGFDVGDAGLGLARTIMPGFLWTDIMSYCPREWASDVSYLNLRGSIGLVATAASPQLAGDFLVVSGLLDAEHQAAALVMSQRMSAVPMIPGLVTGPYHLRLLDAADVILADYAFTPTLNTDTPELAMIFQIVNWEPGTRRIALYSDLAGAELLSVPVSANAPTVGTPTHSGGASLGSSGPVSVSWTAADADGNPLTYVIKYSADNGVTWRPLATGLTSTSVIVDAAELEGTGGASTGRFRIVASDGVLTGQADSAAFSVAGKAPQVQLASPADGATYTYGQLVALQGFGQDFEDGTLPDGNLDWTSNQDGPLGGGGLVHVSELSVGTHQLTLQAIDSDGQSGSATVTVTVVADLPVFGPTLAAGPGDLLFGSQAGAVSPPAQLISIRNLGSGALTWTASADAAWLVLGAAGGSAPDELSLSINSALLPPAAEATAHLTLTAPGAIDSPKIIVVTVQQAGAWIFLPLVTR